MSTKQRIRSKQLLQHAEGYLELSMPRHALVELSRIDDVQPDDWRVDFLRGEALRSLERYDEALPYLRRASDIAPDNVHIWLALGWCYKRVGQIDMAIDSLENALGDDDESAIVLYNLACYWSLAGNKQQALDHLARAIDVDIRYRDMVYEEPDFDPLRDDADFQALTSVIV